MLETRVADSPDAKWSAHAVIRILQDETYTGVLLQGKQETHNHKLKNIRLKPSGEWIRTENAHEPIIRKHDFELVQSIMSLDTRTTPDGKEVYLFSGLLICGCCGGRMTRKTNTVNGRKYIYYHCPTGKKKGCDRPVMLKESDLVKCVLESLQAYIRNIVSLEELLDSISEEEINQKLIAGFKAQIADNEVQIDKSRRFKSMLYENLVSGLITKEEFRYNQDLYTTQIEQAQEAVRRLRAEMDRAADNTSDRLRWTRHFREFAAMTTLDRRAVIALIQSIRVLGKESFDITFRYELERDQELEKLVCCGKLPPALAESIKEAV